MVDHLRKHTTSIAVFVLSCLLIAASGITQPLFAAEEMPIPLTNHLSMALKTKRFFSSHTSYEFGNPFPPYQAPLSRLEFPLNSLWGGAEVRANFSRFSLGVEAFRNLSGEADGMMRDSDWDDENMPNLRTIYSESKCRMKASHMVIADMDVQVADLLGAPQWFRLRPVIGFRWQDFNLVTHDGVQTAIDDPDAPLLLPGDGVRFSQTYWQYFIGLRSDIDAGRFIDVSGLNLLMQLDWAYVEAKNVDHHLLKTGRRFTYEDSYGQSWHAAFRLKKAIYESLSLNVGAEYLRIDTAGSHRLVNAPMDIDFSLSNGVKVWSEQASIFLSLEYRFSEVFR